MYFFLLKSEKAPWYQKRIHCLCSIANISTKECDIFYTQKANKIYKKDFPYKTMVKSMLLEQIVLSILSNQMRDTIINIKGSWQLIPLKISIDNWTFMSIKKKEKSSNLCHILRKKCSFQRQKRMTNIKQ